jgi:hypothetical protein
VNFETFSNSKLFTQSTNIYPILGKTQRRIGQ